MKTLAEVRSEVERLGAFINADAAALPTFGSTEDFARPHIEVDSNGYHYVIVERGTEWSRHTTVNLDDLLYHVFETVTFELACKYELTNRIEKQDFRRILWRRQDELLNLLSQNWADRRAVEQQGILQNHPFDDEA